VLKSCIAPRFHKDGTAVALAVLVAFKRPKGRRSSKCSVTWVRFERVLQPLCFAAPSDCPSLRHCVSEAVQRRTACVNLRSRGRITQ
jgi:hypothetical protein